MIERFDECTGSDRATLSQRGVEVYEGYGEMRGSTAQRCAGVEMESRLGEAVQAHGG
jgi:hypothetical protein